MKIIFLDFESYYDSDYSLRKMTPVEYVLDPRFKVNGLAVQEGLEGKPYWLDDYQVADFFAKLDPNDTCLVTHNALFDMCIVSWVYGFVPKLMTCTMSVARAVRGHLLARVSLASVSEHLGLPAKGDVIHQVKGMDLAMIKDAGLYVQYKDYALRDVANCAGIYKRLVVEGEFPRRELAVMDMVLRCAIEPQFQLDSTMLAEHLALIRAEKEQQLAQAMLLGADGKSDLMSNDKFAELLKGLGVDPPRKVSLLTGRETYALAKKDPEFLALLDHDEPAVQTLVAARLGHKSTLEETRVERFLKIASLDWSVTHLGKGAWMPMPLRFSGAHTHRLSGDWSLNVQNLPRRGKLRRALIAPPGYKVLVVDASQIEARLTAWLCRQEDLVAQFARGEDVYSNFASDVFSRPVNKKDNPNERFVGKTGILGLGFGVGWPKFQVTVKVDSKLQTGNEILLTDSEAQGVVTTYRRKFHRIPQTWTELNSTGIAVLSMGGSWDFGPVRFEKGAVLLPTGLRLFYHDIQQQNGEWICKYNVNLKKVYGGKLLENIVQALDRCIVFEAGLRIQKRIAPYRLAQQAHDEMAYVVKDEDVDAVKAIILEEMTRVPDWAAGLPLAAEAGVGQSYGDAK